MNEQELIKFGFVEFHADSYIATWDQNWLYKYKINGKVAFTVFIRFFKKSGGYNSLVEFFDHFGKPFTIEITVTTMTPYEVCEWFRSKWILLQCQYYG